MRRTHIFTYCVCTREYVTRFCIFVRVLNTHDTRRHNMNAQLKRENVRAKIQAQNYHFTNINTHHHHSTIQWDAFSFDFTAFSLIFLIVFGCCSSYFIFSFCFVHLRACVRARNEFRISMVFLYCVCQYGYEMYVNVYILCNLKLQ